MKIAVLMSTYNGEKYLKEQIDSILNQKTELKVVLIVRDDGSKDKTCDILEEYQRKKLLKFTKEKNIGASKSFLQLLYDNPGYDYYAFSDQDDVWKDDKIQKAYEQIKNVKTPGIYCSNCELVNDNLISIGRLTHRNRPNYSKESILTLTSCAQGCTTVMNNSFAKILQSKVVKGRFIMHDSLITCLCALTDSELVYDNNPSMLYRIHGKNVFGLATKKQHGVFGVMYSRVKEITTRRKIGMSEQIETILETYGDYINQDNLKLASLIVSSKKSIISRIKIITNKNLKGDTINSTITKKLRILLGNN